MRKISQAFAPPAPRLASETSDRTFLAVLNEVEKASIRERQPLPEAYLGLSDDEMSLRIAAARAALGDRLVILGHHYQRDEVIKFADYTGDSFKLANAIAKHPQADYIVFCGVHFMAESADILAMPHQKIILPDLAAGCSMADMAPADQLEICWSELTQMGVAFTRRPDHLHQFGRGDQSRSSARTAAPSAPRRTPPPR